ncbi:hypothetical protein SERLA73DRAFT_118684 [Serpula lacrymans var. lacrymans S7.3]|uniref:DDE-1 domain-containing protein n=1 Tax=Serpula lacrymans var. lacrymans (strain S7.3) TaxID=936435 RepID=F8PHM9_SERL3|nr:hypothetical protein SERLA73DRAFT_118684 [Serpula lacrymans var. lacrymans S7.3]
MVVMHDESIFRANELRCYTNAREIIFPGENHEGWWNTERLITQDALNAKEMNIKPGGKQRKMKSTYITDNNLNVSLHSKSQDMVFPHDLLSNHPDFEFCGQAKGMLPVLEEQGLIVWCCMQKVLSLQKDFMSERPLLQVLIKDAGHRCYFLPKYHCELNHIDMYWGWTKESEC